MGRQIRFFMDGGDEKTFIDFARTTGEVLMLVDPSPKADFNPVSELPNVSVTKFWTRVWLFNKSVSSNLVPVFVPNQRYYMIDCLRSSVVEFRRTTRSDDAMRPGRLWMEYKYANPDGRNWIPKEPEFKAWYDTLARWIRKNYSREIDPDFYVGAGALKLIQERKVHVKYF